MHISEELELFELCSGWLSMHPTKERGDEIQRWHRAPSGSGGWVLSCPYYAGELSLYLMCSPSQSQSFLNLQRRQTSSWWMIGSACFLLKNRILFTSFIGDLQELLWVAFQNNALKPQGSFHSCSLPPTELQKWVKKCQKCNTKIDKVHLYLESLNILPSFLWTCSLLWFAELGLIFYLPVQCFQHLRHSIILPFQNSLLEWWKTVKHFPSSDSA